MQTRMMHGGDDGSYGEMGRGQAGAEGFLSSVRDSVYDQVNFDLGFEARQARQSKSMVIRSDSRGRNVMSVQPPYSRQENLRNTSDRTKKPWTEIYGENLERMPNVTTNKDQTRSRLYVGGLDQKLVTRKEVFRLFASFGHITAISELQFQTNSKGAKYAFVQYANESSVQQAIAKLNKKRYGGFDLVVRSVAEADGSRSVQSPRRSPGYSAEFKKPMLPPRTLLDNPRGAFPSSSSGQLSRAAGRGFPQRDNYMPASSVGNYKRPGTGSYVDTSADSNSNHYRDFKRPGSSSYVDASEEKHARKSPSQSMATTEFGHSMSKEQKVSKKPSPDILLCGTCRSMFDSIEKLVDHKKSPCHPVTKCVHCEGVPAVVSCAVCYREFQSPWLLVKHFHDTHNVMVCVQAESLVNLEKKEDVRNGEGDRAWADEPSHSRSLDDDLRLLPSSVPRRRRPPSLTGESVLEFDLDDLVDD